MSELPEGPVVEPGSETLSGPQAWDTVLATEAAESCAVRFANRYPDLVSHPPGTEWMEHIGEVLLELQQSFGVNPLVLVLCDTAASYLTQQIAGQGGSGGGGLDMSIEDDLTTQFMALFGADDLSALPVELGEALTALSALQEQRVAWARGDSQVWLVPGAIREWVMRHYPTLAGMGDDLMSPRGGPPPSIPESEVSSVISRGWHKVATEGGADE